MNEKLSNKITSLQGFCTTIRFLERYYSETHSDDAGGLLSDMSLIENRGTADPAVWEYWTEALDVVIGERRKKNNSLGDRNNLITEREAFFGMIKFLEEYCALDDIASLVSILQTQVKSEEITDSVMGKRWIQGLQEVLAEKNLIERFRLRIG